MDQSHWECPLCRGINANQQNVCQHCLGLGTEGSALLNQYQMLNANEENSQQSQPENTNNNGANNNIEVTLQNIITWSNYGPILSVIVPQLPILLIFLIIVMVRYYKLAILFWLNIAAVLRCNSSINYITGNIQENQWCVIATSLVQLIFSLLLMTFLDLDGTRFALRGFIYRFNALDCTIYNIIYSLVLLDAAVKFVGYIIKLVAHCYYKSNVTVYRRCLSIIECLVISFRIYLPIPFLSYYLYATTHPFFLRQLFLSAYVIVKVSTFSRFLANIIEKSSYINSSTEFGRPMSQNELLEGGYDSKCPICQDDYNSPILLPCGHPFCATCVNIWLETNSTCPLCRTALLTPKWDYADGSTSLYIMLF